MFFVIVGVSPKDRRVDDRPGICPVCGQLRAYRRRIDHYFNLFFIPLFRVKAGEEFVFCENCQRQVAQAQAVPKPHFQAGRSRCPSCGKGIEADFRFCPHCGQRL